MTESDWVIAIILIGMIVLCWVLNRKGGVMIRLIMFALVVLVGFVEWVKSLPEAWRMAGNYSRKNKIKVKERNRCKDTINGLS